MTGQTGPGRPSRWKTALVLAAFLYLAASLLDRSCFFVRVLGIPCAGCGSSRALALLLQGRLAEALRMHPLILVSLALVLALAVYLVFQLAALIRGKSLRFPLAPATIRLVVISLLVLYLGVYLVRMILFFPDQEPLCYNHDSVWGRLFALFRGLTPD